MEEVVRAHGLNVAEKCWPSCAGEFPELLLRWRHACPYAVFVNAIPKGLETPPGVLTGDVLLLVFLQPRSVA